VETSPCNVFTVLSTIYHSGFRFVENCALCTEFCAGLLAIKGIKEHEIEYYGVRNKSMAEHEGAPMQEVWIRLSSAKQVQKFVGDLVPLEGDFELISDCMLLDARSLMGIFGFDLSKPLRLKIYHDSLANLKAIEPYRVDVEGIEHE